MESSESNVQKWAWKAVGLLLGIGRCSAVAAKLFVLVATAVPILPCKMWSHHLKTIRAFCLHCFLLCRSCHLFLSAIFTSCYWKTSIRWKNDSQSHPNIYIYILKKNNPGETSISCGPLCCYNQKVWATKYFILTDNENIWCYDITPSRNPQCCGRVSGRPAALLTEEVNFPSVLIFISPYTHLKKLDRVNTLTKLTFLSSPFVL